MAYINAEEVRSIREELKLQYNSTTGRCELWVDDLKQYDQSKRILV